MAKGLFSQSIFFLIIILIDHHDDFVSGMTFMLFYND